VSNIFGCCQANKSCEVNKQIGCQLRRGKPNYLKKAVLSAFYPLYRNSLPRGTNRAAKPRARIRRIFGREGGPERSRFPIPELTRISCVAGGQKAQHIPRHGKTRNGHVKFALTKNASSGQMACARSGQKS
jgi:hypothetical protein